MVVVKINAQIPSFEAHYEKVMPHTAAITQLAATVVVVVGTASTWVKTLPPTAGREGREREEGKGEGNARRRKGDEEGKKGNICTFKQGESCKKKLKMEMGIEEPGKRNGEREREEGWKK